MLQSYFKKLSCQAWWCTSVISALGKVKQEDHTFEAGLSYIARPCLQKKKKVSSNRIKDAFNSMMAILR
jgi:hypothetical protein